MKSLNENHSAFLRNVRNSAQAMLCDNPVTLQCPSSCVQRNRTVQLCLKKNIVYHIRCVIMWTRRLCGANTPGVYLREYKDASVEMHGMQAMCINIFWNDHRLRKSTQAKILLWKSRASGFKIAAQRTIYGTVEDRTTETDIECFDLISFDFLYVFHAVQPDEGSCDPKYCNMFFKIFYGQLSFIILIFQLLTLPMAIKSFYRFTICS